MNRRSFLKLLGGTTVAAVAAPLITPSTAPLFIPPERLDMGVPRRILTATELPPRPWRTTLTTPDGVTYTTRVVPMPQATYWVDGERGLWPGSPTSTLTWENKFLRAEELAVIVPISLAEYMLEDTDRELFAEFGPSRRTDGMT